MFGIGAQEMVVLLFPLLLSGGGAPPLGVPPAAEDPLMARVAPEECLLYVSWSGIAEPQADSANRTESLLAEPAVQRLIKDVDRRLMQAFSAAAEGEDADSPEAMLAKHGSQLGRILLTHPTAIFLSHFKPPGDDDAFAPPAGPDIRGGMLVNLGDDAPKVKAALEKLQKQLLGDAVEAIDVAGVPAFRIQPPERGAPAITWSIRGKYLLVGVGKDSFAGMLARVRTEPPAWLTSVRRDLAVPRISMTAYADVKAILEIAKKVAGRGRDAEDLAAMTKVFGLKDATTFSLMTGLDDEGFILRSQLGIDGDLQGALTLADAKPLSPLDLLPIPADATLAVAARLDLMARYQDFHKLASEVEPRLIAELDEGVREIKEETGIQLIDGIFASLGDVWCAYNSPSEGGLLTSGLTATVTVGDYAKLKTEYDKAIKFFTAQLAEVRGFRGGRGPALKEIEFAGHKIHFLTSGGSPLFIAPSFCLTEEYVIFSLFPQNIKAFLSRGKNFQSLADSKHVGSLLKMSEGPSAFSYQNTPELMKYAYPLVQMFGQVMSTEMAREGFELDMSLLPPASAILPHMKPDVTTLARTKQGILLECRTSLPGGIAGSLAPIVLGTTAPAIEKSLRTAKRTRSMNNLKHIALALHNYHSAHGSMPPAFTTDKDGKPLLSWRVAILPYLGRSDLYDAFHRDEPWDSEHNKKLIARMPEILRAPTSKAAAGDTVYLSVRGEQTLFSVREGKPDKVRFAHVRDGLTNTIMVVEASDMQGVPWTAPDDFKYEKKDPLNGLVGQHKGGFLAALGDGSVRFLAETIDAEILRRLFDRADGQVIDARALGAARRPRRGQTFAMGPDRRPAFAPDRRRAEPHDHDHGEHQHAEKVVEKRVFAARVENSVSGVFTLDGEPLAGATISFQPLGAKKPAAVVDTDKAGRFAAQSIPPGRYVVTIKSANETGKSAKETGGAKTPKKYASPETSGLQVEVRGGQNVLNFELSTK